MQDLRGSRFANRFFIRYYGLCFRYGWGGGRIGFRSEHSFKFHFICRINWRNSTKVMNFSISSCSQGYHWSRGRMAVIFYDDDLNFYRRCAQLIQFLQKFWTYFPSYLRLFISSLQRLKTRHLSLNGKKSWQLFAFFFCNLDKMFGE